LKPGVNRQLHWYIAVQARCFASPGCKLSDPSDFHFMKRASLAAVFVALMAWNALAANSPAQPADELYDKAMELYGQRKFVEALPLAQQVVGVDEKALGPDHLDFAKDLNLLGLLYHELRHYADAETCYKRSLAIREEQLWPDHPDVAQSVSNLGLLHIAEGHYAPTPNRFSSGPWPSG
jgi:tetratricopeptide (TPR) repeat protein